MKPTSYREQHLNCCATCLHNIDIAGITALVCGFGEDLNKDSFYDALRKEDDKPYNFDECEFTNRWLADRWVHEFDICNEYKLNAPDHP